MLRVGCVRQPAIAAQVLADTSRQKQQGESSVVEDGKAIGRSRMGSCWQGKL